MAEFAIPGRGVLRLEYLVLDLNGTLSLDGELIDGVIARLEQLRDDFTPCLLTADMHGTATELATNLQLELRRIKPTAEPEQKGAIVRELGPQGVVAIGAGANDAGMLDAAALGIAVLGLEGLAISALRAADVVTPSITEALDLLLVPDRLIATLRR